MKKIRLQGKTNQSSVKGAHGACNDRSQVKLY